MRNIRCCTLTESRFRITPANFITPYSRFSVTKAETVRFARNSKFFRRKILVWAPAHKDFLLKIFTPPFKSFVSIPQDIGFEYHSDI
jgi:hypothetical protein